MSDKSSKYIIRPLYDRVVIEPVEDDDTTSGGIIIPDNAKEKPMKGKVVAVGGGTVSGEKHTPLLVKCGDMVIYGKWAGTKYKLNSKDVLIMKESDLLAIIES